MLKPTLRRLSPAATADGSPRSISINIVGLFLSLFLLGILFVGCGDDAPQREENRPGENDTAAPIGPNDTMAAAPAGTIDSATAQTTAAVEATTSVGTSGTTAAGKGTATAVSVSNPGTTTGAGASVSTATVAAKQGNDPVGTGEGKPFDPAPFDALLRAHVANGKVDYAAFKGSTEFAGFLQALATASPDGMSANGKLAFWINAYNALVIKNVNDNPGIKQPLDVPGFFDKKKFTVAGKQLTLNQIENEIVRPTFKEPLIHFGLVCAARSCPPLIAKTYTEGNVRSQLAANAEAYLGDTKQNRYDAGTKTLYLSKIFEWYKDDFGGNDAGLIAFAKGHGPDAMKSALASATDVKVKFNEYDWTLNKK